MYLIGHSFQLSMHSMIYTLRYSALAYLPCPEAYRLVLYAPFLPLISCRSNSVIPFSQHGINSSLCCLSKSFLLSRLLKSYAFLPFLQFQLILIPSFLPVGSHFTSAVRTVSLSAWVPQWDGLELNPSTVFTSFVTFINYLMCLFLHL